ncbi:hypothetical protein MKX01_003468 [Papaver californicum]|nr:hypothetical protein MKX01_003468 [Papaver californicum]
MFGHEMTKENREKNNPALRWKSYGDSAPELQRVIVHIFSATCNASSCERKLEHIREGTYKEIEPIFTPKIECTCLYMESDGEWITEKDDVCLQRDPTWMDVHNYFQITEPEANKKKGLRNLSTMKLAQGKGNNKGKETILVDTYETEEIEESEIEEETHAEEMSETEIQVESENEWVYDDGYNMRY